MSTALADLPRPLIKYAQGCHLYVVGVNQENPDEIWITEIWESKDDQDSSLNVSGGSEMIEKTIPILDGSPGKRTIMAHIGRNWNRIKQAANIVYSVFGGRIVWW